MAVFLPLIVGFGWYFYNAIVNLEVLKVGVFKTIGIVMAKATTPFTSGMGFDLESVDFDPTKQTSGELIRSMLNGLTNPSIYYGLIFAAVTIALAIYVRRFRNTT